MDLNKKRVSFSHVEIEVPMINVPSPLLEHGRLSADSSCTDYSMDSQNNRNLLEVNKRTQLSSSSGDYLTNENNDSGGHDRGDHSPNSIMAQINSMNFTETRRRSHAFSVSAIDDSLSINLDDDEHLDENYSDLYSGIGGVIDAAFGVDSENQTTDSPLPPHIRRKLEKLHKTQSKSFRHAQIPITTDCEVLMCYTKSQLVTAKSFSDEIRTARDVETYLQNPYLILNLEGNSVDNILQQMLETLEHALSKPILTEIRHSLLEQLSPNQFSDSIQGIYHTEDGQYLHDPTWLCTFASINQLYARRVVIARLQKPTNFGATLRAVQFVVLVLVPIKEKCTKSAYEIARTFATLFADSSLRIALSAAQDEKRFLATLEERVKNLKTTQNKILNPKHQPIQKLSSSSSSSSSMWFSSDGGGGPEPPFATNTGKFNLFKAFQNPLVDIHPTKKKFQFSFAKGLKENFLRRIKYYPSDFVDGVADKKTLLKVSAATFSLFFACILPCVAFGVLDAHNTDDAIGPKEALLGQTVGGLVFALFSGQPLVIIATTAPLCLYTSIVHRVAANINVNFFDLYAAVGLWNALFLILYAMFGLSEMMHLCTRSTEEIFAIFIFFAFTIDAIKECVSSFQTHYCFVATRTLNLTNNHSNLADISNESVNELVETCSPAKSVLFLFLMLGTLILAVWIYKFSSTPYLSALLRDTFAGYALPLAVIIFSIIGSVAFKQVNVDSFQVSREFKWRFATLTSLNVAALFLSLGLGFALSILFFIDQNVSAALVSSPSNKLKKGDAYHWDLLVVGVLNALLSIIGLPWMHGILPHSPIHARSLADLVPAQNDSSSSMVVVRIRETRVTGILIHLLIGAVMLFAPDSLGFIPVAVLCGLFLFCAYSTLTDNSLYERVLLFCTEQVSYPPSHYLRHCPQKVVHLFTSTQLAQLAVICLFGFAPWEYVQLIFPLIIALLIPIRWFILPLFIDANYLSIIDNKHF